MKDICCLCNQNPVEKTKCSTAVICKECREIKDKRLKYMVKGIKEANWIENNPFLMLPKIIK